MTAYDLGIIAAGRRNVPGHLKQAYAQGFAGAWEKAAAAVKGIKFFTPGKYYSRARSDLGARMFKERVPLREAINSLQGAKLPEGAAGFAYAGSREAVVSKFGPPHRYLRPEERPYWRRLNRGTVAHEAFHARNPILGRSELLAHLYTMIKARRITELRDYVREYPIPAAIHSTTGIAGAELARRRLFRTGPKPLGEEQVLTRLRDLLGRD